jgi:flavin-dependent dehydrogenase
MAVARHGYVGAVDVEDGRVNVAAALDSEFLKVHGEPSRAVAALLDDAGVVFDARLESVDWGGTIPLTRHMRRPASRRLFVLGDAAGYVEPFTGEGMGWAMAGAEAVVPLASRAIGAWDGGLAREWIVIHTRRIRRAQRWCRVLARVLRTPALIGPLVTLLHRYPALARPALAHFRQRTLKP